MRALLRGRFRIGACVALMAVLQATSAIAGVVPRALYDKAAREGPVRVIVQFRAPMTPEGDLQGADAVASQRQNIAATRYAALATLAGTSHRTIREFTTIPFVALEVAPDAMAALEASPNVVGVEEDRLENVALSESVPLIGANQAWAAGVDGTGSVVAILDTGIDKTHPFLSGKVVREACFSANGSCPNGQTSQIGSGTGVPCTYAPNDCRHGTHVAGIVAGSGVSFSGVAKGAGIIAVQVFSRFTGTLCAGGEDPCALASVSDLIAGLEHVFSLRGQLAIAAVNLSLGGATRFTAPCDSVEAARKAVIDNLRSVGIATIAASGNEGFSDGLVAPACISTAVSVGSTTKSDVVSSFSNSASFLSLLAPGESITSSVPGGGFAVGSGTSAAAPHAAGVWAILKQRKPSATVAELLTALRNTGLLITDPRNNVTTPRIRVDQALQAITVFTAPLVLRDAVYLYGPPLNGKGDKVLVGVDCDVFQLVLDVTSGYTDLAMGQGGTLANALGTQFPYVDTINNTDAMFAYALYQDQPVKTFAFNDQAHPTSSAQMGTATAFGYCYSTKPTAKVYFHQKDICLNTYSDGHATSCTVADNGSGVGSGGYGELLLRDAIYLYGQALNGKGDKILAGEHCDVFQLVLDVTAGYTDLAMGQSSTLNSALAAQVAYPDRILDAAAMFSYALYDTQAVKAFVFHDQYNPASSAQIGTATAFGYCYSTNPAARVYLREVDTCTDKDSTGQISAIPGC
ncbi:S8 family peptidase [Candidatus Methylomirabilis sp.]|uniref:S8 family peptidase n=1 Tax=Candidatus Methylomirabilis sp. TaxID=2032687 RepID=UPI003C75F265